MTEPTSNSSGPPSSDYDPAKDYFVLLTAGCLAFGLTGVVEWLDGGSFNDLHRIALSVAVVLIVRATILHRAARRSKSHGTDAGDAN